MLVRFSILKRIETSATLIALGILEEMPNLFQYPQADRDLSNQIMTNAIRGMFKCFSILKRIETSATGGRGGKRDG